MQGPRVNPQLLFHMSLFGAQVIVEAPDAATGTYAAGATPLLVSGGRLWRGLELWAAPHRCLRSATGVPQLVDSSCQVTRTLTD